MPRFTVSSTLFSLLYAAVLRADAAVGADRHHPQHAVARSSDPDAAADRRHPCCACSGWCSTS
ncbi:hypothetical protein M8494_23440 [Serratia ureilytica]